MRILIRKFVSNTVPKNIQLKLKNKEYRYKRKLVSSFPEITQEKLICIFKEKLNIKDGDNLFIHSSTDMINSDLSVRVIADLLFSIIGSSGSITVPTFIRYNSKDWMESDSVFNYHRTISGMGAFSEHIRKRKESLRSLHPTKSCSTIGPIAQEILGEHHLSEFAFDQKSPFYKLLNYNVKVIGIGVKMSYLSMVHTVEDCYPQKFPINVNGSQAYSKSCVSADNTIFKVKSHVHIPKVVLKANPERFVKKYLSKKSYNLYNHWFSPFFSIYGRDLYDSLYDQMKIGKTIYD